jgi:hypothetical protein
MNDLNSREFDGDARFTFLLSLLTGVATLGLSHLYVFHLVRKRAATCQHAANNISAIAVPGHQLDKGKISSDYQSRLDRAAVLYNNSNNAVIRILGGRPHLGISEAHAGSQYLVHTGKHEAFQRLVCWLR